MQPTNDSNVPSFEIEFHCRIRLLDGTIIEDTFQKTPVKATLGEGELIVGLETELSKLQPGESHTITLPPEVAYGYWSEDAIREVPRSELVKEVPLIFGMELAAQGPEGELVPVRILDSGDDKIRIDFNHPLVDKDLVVDIELLSRRHAPQRSSNLIRLTPNSDFESLIHKKESTVIATFYDGTHHNSYEVLTMIEALALGRTETNWLLINTAELPDVAEQLNILATPMYRVYVNGNEKANLLGASQEQLEAIVDGNSLDRFPYPDAPVPGMSPLYSIYPLDEASVFDLVEISAPLFFQELERFPKNWGQAYRNLCPILIRWLDRVYAIQGERLLGLAIEPPAREKDGKQLPNFDSAILHLVIDEPESVQYKGPSWYEELNLAMDSLGVPLHALHIHNISEIRKSGQAGVLSEKLGNSLLFSDRYGLLAELQAYGKYRL